jgi:hypothetical protein
LRVLEKIVKRGKGLKYLKKNLEWQNKVEGSGDKNEIGEVKVVEKILNQEN